MSLKLSGVCSIPSLAKMIILGWDWSKIIWTLRIAELLLSSSASGNLTCFPADTTNRTELVRNECTCFVWPRSGPLISIGWHSHSHKLQAAGECTTLNMDVSFHLSATDELISQWNWFPPSYSSSSLIYLLLTNYSSMYLLLLLANEPIDRVWSFDGMS